MTGKKRLDGREADETRKIEAKVGIIENAAGSAYFAFGDTKAIAAVYGPKLMYPQHSQDQTKATLKCIYDMLSFSVNERKKPGPSRRSMEISQVTKWAFEPVVELKLFPSTEIDIYIMIMQADASTRCAGINAASMALAQAGIPMKELVTAVSAGKVEDKIVVDLCYEEEAVEGATDIAFAFTPSKKITLMQLDGEISPEDLKKARALAEKTCQKIYKKMEEALKSIKE